MWRVSLGKAGVLGPELCLGSGNVRLPTPRPRMVFFGKSETCALSRS